MDALDFDLKEIFDDENDENSKENDDLEVSTPKLKAIADQPKKGKPQRKPQPKLDPQKLISEKGILQLPKLFETVKFKGKGHEAEDLKRILQTYELWAYRLFPKMPFDDFIERAEKLGEKREVKTCLKRIRMGVFNDDNADQSDGETNKNDEFEMDIALEKAIPDDDFWSDSTTRTKDDILMPPPAPVGAVANTDTAISEDQMDRMARNRALALEKKRQRDRELALTKFNPYEETPSQCQIIPDSASTVNTFNGDAILEIEEKMATEDEILKDLDSSIPEETPKETPEVIPEETPEEIQTE